MHNPAASHRAFRVTDFILTLLLATAIGFLAIVAVYGSFKFLHGGPAALKQWLVHIQIEGTGFGPPPWSMHDWSWWQAAQPEFAIAGIIICIWLARFGVRRKMRV